MPTQTQLFCFDFDNTIVNGHFHYQLACQKVAPGKATPAQIESLIKKYGILNKDELLKTFKQILENGHKIAITTWSDYPEVVIPTLKEVGLNDAQIKQIFVASGIPKDHNSRKSTHIERAKKNFSITDNTKVVLIDDDELNIQHAKQEGQLGILVKPTNGYLQETQNIATKYAAVKMPDSDESVKTENKPSNKDKDIKARSGITKGIIAISAGIAIGLGIWYLGFALWASIAIAVSATAMIGIAQLNTVENATIMNSSASPVISSVVTVTEKKPTAKKVQIAELNTEEGNRLYHVRYDLRARGKVPCPPRKDGETPLNRYLRKKR